MGALTTSIKAMIKKDYVKRVTSTTDHRVIYIEITEKGEQLKEAAAHIPEDMTERWLNISRDEVKNMYHALYKLLSQL